MKNLRTYVWAAFIAALIYTVGQRIYLKKEYGKSFDIIKLELADKAKGSALLASWSVEEADGSSLLYYARMGTWVDFIFIFGYTGVLIIISRALMRHQQNSFLKSLLRLCVFLALLAGLFDIAENTILLNDMHNYYPGKDFITAKYASWPKWILVALVPLLWLVSGIGQLVRKKS